MSSVDINSGEIGQIIERLDIWDYAVVDFSIEIPCRFQNLNTKLIIDDAFDEAILIPEEMQIKK